MNLYKQSRRSALWLLITVCAATFANAQNQSNAIEHSIKNVEKNVEKKTAFAKFSPEKTSNRKKTGIYEGVSFDETEAESKKQTDSGSNKEWAVYGGSYSVHKDLKGESQKAPVVLFGIRHAWTTKNNPSHRLRYYMDLNPLIIVNYRQKILVQTSPTTTETVGDRKTVFGVGFVPVGLQFNWRNSKTVQPYIAGAFGFALFNKKFPDNRSALEPDEIGNRFQMMPEFGAGVEIRKSPTKSYFIGYKYHHMSNAYTAPLNVGYNTNMIYGGVYFQRGNN